MLLAMPVVIVGALVVGLSAAPVQAGLSFR